MTEPAPSADGRGRSSRLFDLRYLIGGLLALYGVVLTIVGAVDSDAEIERSAGIRINLWMGLGMLVAGGLFLLWARLRPLRVADRSAAADPDRPAPPGGH